VGQLNGNIKSVIVTARTARGVLALVTLDNGRYAIARDNELLPEHHWHPNHIQECIDTFMKLSLPDGHK
jgi:hypothetical protein